MEKHGQLHLRIHQVSDSNIFVNVAYHFLTLGRKRILITSLPLPPLFFSFCFYVLIASTVILSMFFLCCVSCRVYFVGCRCIVIALHILYYTQHLTSRAQTSIACIWFPIWLFLYFLFIFLCCVISARCFFFYFLYRSIQYYRHIDNVLCTDRAHCTLHNILTQFRVIISNAI